MSGATGSCGALKCSDCAGTAEMPVTALGSTRTWEGLAVSEPDIRVYVRPNDPKSEWTLKLLDRHNVEYETVDATMEQGQVELAALGYGIADLPVVLTPRTHWTGFDKSKVLALAKARHREPNEG